VCGFARYTTLWYIAVVVVKFNFVSRLLWGLLLIFKNLLDISRGSVAKRLICGGIFNDGMLFANFSQNILEKNENRLIFEIPFWTTL